MAQTLTSDQAALKLAVETQTGGEQTIIFTDKGQPCYMYKLKKFDMSEVNPAWSGTHPAFIVNGVEKDYIYIGVYSGSLVDGEMLSQPSRDPLNGSGANEYGLGSSSLQTAIKMCGAGFHMMTNDEWAAIGLICRKNGWFPYGITVWQEAECYSALGGITQTGIKSRNASEVALGAIPFIYSGTGTNKFRHNLKYTGISDLVGNQHNRVVGFRLINTEIQVIDPNYTKTPDVNDLSRNSNLWKAIDATTGDLIDRAWTGTIADSTYTPTTNNSVRFGLTASANTIGAYGENIDFALEILDYSQLGAAAVTKLQQLGILSTIKYANPSSYGKTWNDINLRVTPAGQYNNGVFSIYDACRGGGIDSSHFAIDSYMLNHPDDLNNPNVTCRTCYFEP